MEAKRMVSLGGTGLEKAESILGSRSVTLAAAPAATAPVPTRIN
jgi:hypothetical protein